MQDDDQFVRLGATTNEQVRARARGTGDTHTSSQGTHTHTHTMAQGTHHGLHGRAQTERCRAARDSSLGQGGEGRVGHSMDGLFAVDGLRVGRAHECAWEPRCGGGRLRMGKGGIASRRGWRERVQTATRHVAWKDAALARVHASSCGGGSTRCCAESVHAGAAHRPKAQELPLRTTACCTELHAAQSSVPCRAACCTELRAAQSCVPCRAACSPEPGVCMAAMLRAFNA